MTDNFNFFIVDLKHKIIPWVGSLDEMEQRYVSFKKRCISFKIGAQFEQFVCIIGGEDVDELASKYMSNKRKIPKRVLVQIERGDFDGFKQRADGRWRGDGRDSGIEE